MANSFALLQRIKASEAERLKPKDSVSFLFFFILLCSFLLFKGIIDLRSFPCVCVCYLCNCKLVNCQAESCGLQLGIFSFNKFTLRVNSLQWYRALWLGTLLKWNKNIPLSNELRSGWVIEQAIKWAQRSAQEKQEERKRSAIERVSGWVSGLFPTCRFQKI